MNISRRTFAQGVVTILGGLALPGDLFADAGRANLRFAVLSDIHIGGRKTAEANLEKTLRWLTTQHLDAIVSPGDIAHSGYIHQIEAFAAIWNRVFPEGKDADGRKVELMISTGNHDVAAHWVKGTPEWRAEHVLAHGDNLAKVWERLFREKWELVWHKRVKGYSFVGSQWGGLKPPVEAFFAAHADELKGSKPFFYVQHAVPKGTCAGCSAGSSDDGSSTRALTPFPNAVAISGHSHLTPADERVMWQGAFTSFGAGCLHEGGYPFKDAAGDDYQNGGAFWMGDFKYRKMAPINDPDAWGGDPSGAAFLIVDVHDDHLVVDRRSVLHGCPIGPAWVVPLPAKTGGPFDLEKRTAQLKAPEFPENARLVVETLPDGSPLAAPSLKKKPCVCVTFPHVRTVPGGARVFDYVVTAEGSGKKVVRKILADGFCCPEPLADRPGRCLFFADELPADVRYTVTPRDSFGHTGKAITGGIS